MGGMGKQEQLEWERGGGRADTEADRHMQRGSKLNLNGLPPPSLAARSQRPGRHLRKASENRECDYGSDHGGGQLHRKPLRNEGVRGIWIPDTSAEDGPARTDRPPYPAGLDISGRGWVCTTDLRGAGWQRTLPRADESAILTSTGTGTSTG